MRLAFILASPRTVMATSFEARAVVIVCTSSSSCWPSFILSRLSAIDAFGEGFDDFSDFMDSS